MQPADADTSSGTGHIVRRTPRRKCQRKRNYKGRLLTGAELQLLFDDRADSNISSNLMLILNIRSEHEWLATLGLYSAIHSESSSDEDTPTHRRAKILIMSDSDSEEAASTDIDDDYDGETVIYCTSPERNTMDDTEESRAQTPTLDAQPSTSQTVSYARNPEGRRMDDTEESRAQTPTLDAQPSTSQTVSYARNPEGRRMDDTEERRAQTPTLDTQPSPTQTVSNASPEGRRMDDTEGNRAQAPNLDLYEPLSTQAVELITGEDIQRSATLTPDVNLEFTSASTTNRHTYIPLDRLCEMVEQRTLSTAEATPVIEPELPRHTTEPQPAGRFMTEKSESRCQII